ncbi:hypothetical protein [Streptomyces sp. MBT67]|uniref:hypothetical protein n=1 Tax=Streptomyces sp. MBT67 TaxID=1488397 RepID=UPI001F17572A|nr:hypothetical protein [Streptomyces sp. MBT67]
MSQQGEKPAAHEDDWWRKLYDESAPDTGPGRAADSLGPVSNGPRPVRGRLRGPVRGPLRVPGRRRPRGPVPGR